MGWWPLIKLIPKRTNFKFVSLAMLFGVLSFVGCGLSVAAIFSAGLRESPVALYSEGTGGPLERVGHILSQGFNLGIDFKGGTLIELEAGGPVPIDALRQTVSGMGLGDVQVQNFGDPSHALVRFESPAGSSPADVADEVKAEIRGLLQEVEFTRTEVVGPVVSEELFVGGLTALGLAIVMMLIYIWFRFEWQFGLGAILGLFHDVLLVLGLFSIFRIEFTLTIIAALLTIIGYGINDTVVVFDRIRENLRKYKKMPLTDLIDLSINETLSRTIMTGVTALMALAGLIWLGGEALFGFAVAMFFGIVVGTYSSIYVAAPALLIWGVKRGWEDPKQKASAENAAAGAP
jgi:preprotein translocase SecF subunit